VKIARYSHGDHVGLGVAVGNGLVDIEKRTSIKIASMIDLMGKWTEIRAELQLLESAEPDVRLQDIKLLSPVERPGKIMGIGLNYRDHAAEANMALPSEQMWFSKPATAVNTPTGDIDLPIVSDQLDYEAELVVVIGKRCRHVPRNKASEVIFGFCAGNDVSVRDWQFKTSQFILGKSFDTHAPIGPWVVTSDSIDPHRLDIRCTVNGEERQHSNTRHFIFDCYAMVETLSKVMTLEPGDILFTGTPAGVGAVRKPPLWLVTGDIVRVEIEGIGAIENRVVREHH
jgi:2-keto-4-pentenoate hydratase/2-oxohepta-3-ene-1,7-dioic acid hydratase in catechol pathway